MRRGLHMKLVLIMVLLIVSLMTVVGAFLMNSVTGYYINDFYGQMADAFGGDNADFLQDLQVPTEGETDGAAMLDEVLSAYVGVLGVDGRNRNYYVLDGVTGRYLAGSGEEPEGGLEITPNISAALLGQVGLKSDAAASYMDAAVPIHRGSQAYVIYILDNRATVRSLNGEMFTLILEALALGLVISVLLSFLLSKTMVTPLQRLTDGLQEVAAGDFSKKLEVTSRDEIGQLTESFNSMARQLESTIAAVRNERNKLDTLFLHMADGVVAFAGDGSIVHCNPAAGRMLASDVAHLDYDRIFGAIFPLEELKKLQKPNFREAELHVRGRFLEVSFAPFDQDSGTGILSVIHDVTAQRKNEEMRKEFVANVSHELRTPLTNVRSYAETIRDTADIPRDVANSFLDIIIGETDRMTHIVQDLLTLSRLDSGRAEMKMTRFHFGEAIGSVCRAVELDAQRHRHQLLRDYVPQDLPMIIGDRDRLEQVMMNVIGNAIKYTPDGGTIRVTAGPLKDHVWMEVSDNGIGIPRSDWDRIFDRFYRVDKARSRESGGTGLGLSIAREIVQRHGGTIGLTEHQGPGTTVRIVLPIRQDGAGEVRHEG